MSRVSWCKSGHQNNCSPFLSLNTSDVAVSLYSVSLPPSPSFKYPGRRFWYKNNPIQITSCCNSYTILQGKKTSHTSPQGCETPARHPGETGLKLNVSIKCNQQNMTHLSGTEKAFLYAIFSFAATRAYGFHGHPSWYHISAPLHTVCSLSGHCSVYYRQRWLKQILKDQISKELCT